MMTVKEYAVDVNRNVKVILDKCNSLGFSNINNEDDMLTEEQVIDLDNAVYETYEEEELIDKYEYWQSDLEEREQKLKESGKE